MSIKVYKDDSANSIFLEDANGAQFINSLLASVPDGTVTITDLARQIDIVSNANHTDFVDENDNSYPGDAIAVCNALNAIFQSSGTSTTNLPVITSSLGISLVQGQILNYELTADFGVGYEWDLSNVPGITTVDGNVRKLIGGSSLATGEYAIPVKAINYNGEDSQIIELTVGNPAFANSKSTLFNNQQYCAGNAGILQNVLGRSGNGSGASDAWSVSLWFKGSTANQGQTIFYFGDGDIANNGYIQLMQINSSGNKLLRLRYGSNNNNLRLQTPVGSIVAGTWHHILITYDGGTTGSSSGSLNDYYSRFKIFIDGSQVTTNNSQSNYGWSGAINPVNFRFGRTSGIYMRGCNLDEFALWDSDQSSNSANIYNNGTVFDYMNLSQAPLHWWRMGDGDTFPYLFDNGTEANLIMVMSNMTSANFVNDVP